MKKKAWIIIVIILIILVLSAFLLYNRDNYTNVTVKTVDIMNNISESLDDEMYPMVELDEQGVKDKYDIDIERLDDYIIKIPIMNIRTDEIAIVKVKNIRDVEYVKNKFRERVKMVQGTFEDYLQDQYELAKNPLIISKGRYVLMSISERNDDIETIFKSYFIKNK